MDTRRDAAGAPAAAPAPAPVTAPMTAPVPASLLCYESRSAEINSDFFFFE